MADFQVNDAPHAKERKAHTLRQEKELEGGMGGWREGGREKTENTKVEWAGGQRGLC